MTYLPRLFLVLLVSLFIAFTVNAEKNLSPWQPVGYGGGGRFTALAVDPADPRIVYVGSDVAGIFRSKDGGISFELKGQGLGGFAVADIAVNPQPPHEVVALLDDGLYCSLNRGDSWQKLSGEIGYQSRFFGSRLLLFTRRSLWIGTDSRGVFRLPLNNLRSAPEAVSGLENLKINSLTVYDGFLYAGTSRGVYRLEENIWRPQAKGLTPIHMEITDIASSGNSLYLVEKKRGLYRWQKERGLWESRPVDLQPEPKGFKSLLVHPHNPELVFLGSHPEEWPHLLYKTADGGSTWKSLLTYKRDPGAPINWTSTLSGVEEMVFVPGASQTMLMADWWNVWQSFDGGEQWLQRHRGLQNTVINDLKHHPHDPRILFLCTADNGLMISAEGGNNWRRAMKGVVDGHAQEIEISPQDPDRLILLMNPWHKKGRVYLYESRDQGTTWRDIGFPLPPETLPKQGFIDGLATNVELDPQAADTIYVATNGYGVFKTTNGGRSWLQMNRGLATPYLKGPGALKIHPHKPNILFASTQAGGIYKSTDGAASWQRVTTGELFTFGLAIDPLQPSRIIAGAGENRLFISNDEGRSWREVGLPVPPHRQMAVYSVAFHPERPGHILAGTIRYDVRAGEGLFVSDDMAKTFRKVPMDLPAVNINLVTFAPGPKLAGYVGFNGTGIFRVDLGDKRW